MKILVVSLAVAAALAVWRRTRRTVRGLDGEIASPDTWFIG